MYVWFDRLCWGAQFDLWSVPRDSHVFHVVQNPIEINLHHAKKREPLQPQLVLCTVLITPCKLKQRKQYCERDVYCVHVCSQVGPGISMVRCRFCFKLTCLISHPPPSPCSTVCGYCGGELGACVNSPPFFINQIAAPHLGMYVWFDRLCWGPNLIFGLYHLTRMCFMLYRTPLRSICTIYSVTHIYKYDIVIY